jgi:hypothetical protein
MGGVAARPTSGGCRWALTDVVSRSRCLRSKEREGETIDKVDKQQRRFVASSIALPSRVLCLTELYEDGV